MTQPRRHSALESVVNVVVGIGVAFVAQLVVFPLFGWHPPLRDNVAISGVFTGVSLIRSYTIRRAFNRWQA